MNAGADPVLVPGARAVRGVLDASGDTSADARSEHPRAERSGKPTAVVVLCPPHPRYGGTRVDPRLVAVSTALGEGGIDCLRFDYGPWDEGTGERKDVRNALRWAAERYDSVGLFGYSFGATMALLAAGEASGTNASEAPTAVSVLAPDRGNAGTDRDTDRDAVAALDRIGCPIQVVYGERDATVEWEPVVDRARERGFAVEAIPADHFFVGQSGTVAARVASFLLETLE